MIIDETALEPPGSRLLARGSTEKGTQKEKYKSLKMQNAILFY